jgi:hypothetical protein
MYWALCDVRSASFGYSAYTVLFSTEVGDDCEKQPSLSMFKIWNESSNWWNISLTLPLIDKIFYFIFFPDLDTFKARLRLINEDLQVANIPKSKRPRNQALEGLATPVRCGRTTYHRLRQVNPSKPVYNSQHSRRKRSQLKKGKPTVRGGGDWGLRKLRHAFTEIHFGS